MLRGTIAGPAAIRASPVLSSYLTVRTLGLQMGTIVSGFTQVWGYMNSGFDAYAPSTLPKDSCPKPINNVCAKETGEILWIYHNEALLL